MTESARMFLTGPEIVEAALGEQVSMEDLGGPAGALGATASASWSPADDRDAAHLARRLLALLPSSFGGQAPLAPAGPPGAEDPARPSPRRRGRSTTSATSRRAIADEGSVLELSPGWARNMVTALARIEGRPVGVHRQPAAALRRRDRRAAAEKAALFVNSCDRFGIPLVVLVDTPGFMPGSGQERAGVIRHGASLLHAFAGARVPKLTVVLRKAYGGAVITMNSRDLGADIVFAWPSAEVGIMAARQAVGIVHRRALADGNGDAGDLLAQLEDAYAEEHLSADARRRGGLRRRGDRADRDARAAGMGAAGAGAR